MESTLQMIDLGIRYPGQEKNALHSLTMSLASGEILAIVGPSGSGKSSLLRLLAGLEKPTNGCIHMGEKCISDQSKCLSPDKRGIGLVTQGGDLFPHLTIEKNIGYGLHRWTNKEQKARVTELLELIELPHVAKRYPNELSGGEAQRVALARALAPRPKILLLDEPFSSLDTRLREKLRKLTTELLRREKTTTIFVTHHLEDAQLASDRIATLDKGHLTIEKTTPSRC